MYKWKGIQVHRNTKLILIKPSFKKEIMFLCFCFRCSWVKQADNIKIGEAKNRKFLRILFVYFFYFTILFSFFLVYDLLNMGSRGQLSYLTDKVVQMMTKLEQINDKVERIPCSNKHSILKYSNFYFDENRNWWNLTGMNVFRVVWLSMFNVYIQVDF